MECSSRFPQASLRHHVASLAVSNVDAILVPIYVGRAAPLSSTSMPIQLVAFPQSYKLDNVELNHSTSGLFANLPIEQDYQKKS